MLLLNDYAQQNRIPHLSNYIYNSPIHFTISSNDQLISLRNNNNVKKYYNMYCEMFDVYSFNFKVLFYDNFFIEENQYK